MSNRLDRFNEFRELDRILLVMKRRGTIGRELRPTTVGLLETTVGQLASCRFLISRLQFAQSHELHKHNENAYISYTSSEVTVVAASANFSARCRYLMDTCRGNLCAVQL